LDGIGGNRTELKEIGGKFRELKGIGGKSEGIGDH
jgi:hypothetical protein